METGLQPRAASDWPVTPEKRGLEGPLWSVHGCPFVCPSTGQRTPSSLTLSVLLVLNGCGRSQACATLLIRISPERNETSPTGASLLSL